MSNSRKRTCHPHRFCNLVCVCNLAGIKKPGRQIPAILRAATLGAVSAWLVGCSPAATATESPEAVAAAPVVVEPTVEGRRMMGDIQVFASDEYGGRYTLDGSIEKAAQFLVTRHRELGLQPVGQGFEHRYDVRTGVSETGRHTFSVTRGRRSKEVESGDFVPLAFSAGGTVEGDVVFVGYAMRESDSEEGAGYNDLNDIDLKGKVALAFLHEPNRPSSSERHDALDAIQKEFDEERDAFGKELDNTKLVALHKDARKRLAKVMKPYLSKKIPADFFVVGETPGETLPIWKMYRQLQKAAGDESAPKFGWRAGKPINKAKRLAKAGATAVIFIRGARSYLSDENRVQDILPSLEEPPTGEVQDVGIPVVQMKFETAQRLFKVRGRSLGAVQKDIDRKLRPKSSPLKATTVSLSASVESRLIRAPNIVGVLPGTDLADEIVVIGGHFDHIGHREFSGSSCKGNGATGASADIVCNGADDNASGTSMVLELARVMSQRSVKPRRTVVFAHFSGEELGLLGSQAMVKNPPFDLRKVVAMINLDMVGRFDGKGLAIGGVGSSSAWMPMLDSIGAKGMKTVYDRSVVGRSDHANFYEKDIPVLFFFTGVHDDYHRYGDHSGKINVDGMQRIGAITSELLKQIAGGAAVPFSRPTDGEGVVSALPGDREETVEKRIPGDPAVMDRVQVTGSD